MVDVGGAIELTGDDANGYQIRNGTGIRIQGAGVLYRKLDGTTQICWLDEVKPQTSATLKFEDSPSNRSWFAQWDEDNITYSHDKEVDLLLQTHDTINQDGSLELSELPEGHALREEFEAFDGSLDASGQETNGLLSRAEIMEWCRQSW